VPAPLPHSQSTTDPSASIINCFISSKCLREKSAIPSQPTAVFSATSSDSTRNGCPVDQAVTRIWQARQGPDIVERFSDVRRHHHHPVVAHQQTPLVTQQPGQACPFGFGVGHAAIHLIHRDAVEIARGVLVDRQHLGFGQARHRGGVDRVQVQHRPSIGQALMDLAVDRPGRGVHVRMLSTARIIGVQQQQVAGTNAREVLPLRVDQKLFAIRRHGRAEMVGHRLVHAQMSDDPKGRRQVDARLLFNR